MVPNSVRLHFPSWSWHWHTNVPLKCLAITPPAPPGTVRGEGAATRDRIVTRNHRVPHTISPPHVIVGPQRANLRRSRHHMRSRLFNVLFRNGNSESGDVHRGQDDIEKICGTESSQQDFGNTNLGQGPGQKYGREMSSETLNFHSGPLGTKSPWILPCQSSGLRLDFSPTKSSPYGFPRRLCGKTSQPKPGKFVSGPYLIKANIMSSGKTFTESLVR